MALSGYIGKLKNGDLRAIGAEIGRTGLAAEGSGRGQGRSVAQQITGIISHPGLPEGSRSAENKCELDIRNLQLIPFKFIFRLFLGFFALGDLFAKAARMLPVEGFLDRFSERGFLGVANDHPCPRDRLQKRPMQSNRTGQGQGNQNSRQPRSHERSLRPRGFVSRPGVIKSARQPQCYRNSVPSTLMSKTFR
jgi:hypothetical protein